MLSNKPYLLRAFYQWIIDSQCVPILVIDANNRHCRIPVDFTDNGEIVFNISPDAIRDLKISNEAIEFKASFSGVVHFIYAPIQAILAVYAEENGEGIFFDPEEDNFVEGITASDSTNIENISVVQPNMSEMPINKQREKGKPFLKLVE